MIRSFLLMIVMVLTVQVSSFADNRMVEANALNGNGEYDKAIERYNEILNTGVESSELYFNLGYAYYKSGELSRAIINFERAKLLSPNDPDINYNLELSYSQTVDKIEKVGKVFFLRWIDSIESKGNSDFWTYLFLISFAFTLGCAGLYFFGQYMILRKIGFFVGIGLFILSGVSLYFASNQKSKLIHRDYAIVFSSVVTVTSSPDERGTELVVLHEGTKVRVVSKLGEWCEIELSDGNVGWLKESNIEVI